MKEIGIFDRCEFCYDGESAFNKSIELIEKAILEN